MKANKYWLAIMLSGIFVMLPMQGSDAVEETVYGWQLMTEQERNQHRTKMRSLTTEEDREAYRHEHHKMMKQRAIERGVKLPEEPGPRGKRRQYP